jgi:hypothetical protein
VVSSVLGKLDKLSNENYRASSSWELWRRRKAESVPFGNPVCKNLPKAAEKSAAQRLQFRKGNNGNHGDCSFRELWSGPTELPSRFSLGNVEQFATRKKMAYFLL